MTDHNEAQFTSAGTNINEVKRQNAEGGLSYNEVKKLLAQRGGTGTEIYSDTDVEEVKQQIHGKNQ
ncbi:gamma-type small acid-soluble spore protein [Lysinibacillus xylanilyticus]|uniref:gamma-type small acid-soluble spore protein n=1 Tax=Lysinibacillus xylanilyticus TaxID=582475 RepID=UPI0037F657BD